MSKLSNLFGVGLCITILGTMFIFISWSAGPCNFTEKEYKYSSVYNQTGFTLDQAKKDCDKKISEFNTVINIIIIIGIVLMLISLFDSLTDKKVEQDRKDALK